MGPDEEFEGTDRLVFLSSQTVISLELERTNANTLAETIDTDCCPHKALINFTTCPSMEPRHVLAVFAILVAASLVGAPTTMEDWNEQASFSVEQIDQSEIGDGLPVLRYNDLR